MYMLHSCHIVWTRLFPLPWGLQGMLHMCIACYFVTDVYRYDQHLHLYCISALVVRRLKILAGFQRYGMAQGEGG